METSESRTKLFAAMVKANAEIKAVSFDSTNPYYKSQYASLGAVLDVIKPIYAEHGLSIIQNPTSDLGGIGIENIIIHESGEYITNSITLDLGEQKKPAEAAGIAISYLRRYSLASITGLYAEQDTDGDLDGYKGTTKAKPNPENGKQSSTNVRMVTKQDIEATIAAKKTQTTQLNDPAKIDLEAAKAMVGGDGKSYGECTVDELKGKLIGLNKLINETPGDEQDKLQAYIQKRAAVVALLNAKI